MPEDKNIEKKQHYSRSKLGDFRMRFALNKSILCLLVFMTSNSSVARADDYHYTISGDNVIVAMTTSPVDSLVFVFSMRQGDSDEDASASPAIIELDHGKISRFDIQSLASDLNAVWTKDGKHVLFGTEKGIFEADAEKREENPKRIVASESMTHGIALSRSQSRLAYWKWNDKSLQLVAQDVATSKVIRAWTLPFEYGSEPGGFDIAFEGENTVYAYTFDTQWGTPLKRFDLITGKIQTVAPDCMGLAQGTTAIYYIENSKPVAILKKISAGKVHTLFSVADYDSLRSSAGGRWIALRGRTKSAILDTSSDKISAKSTCESMGILSNGTALYVQGAEVSSNPAVCMKVR